MELLTVPWQWKVTEDAGQVLPQLLAAVPQIR